MLTPEDRRVRAVDGRYEGGYVATRRPRTVPNNSNPVHQCHEPALMARNTPRSKRDSPIGRRSPAQVRRGHAAGVPGARSLQRYTRQVLKASLRRRVKCGAGRTAGERQTGEDLAVIGPQNHHRDAGCRGS